MNFEERPIGLGLLSKREGKVHGCHHLACSLMLSSFPLNFQLSILKQSSNLYLLSEQVLDRGEKIELLVDKTENLQFQVYNWSFKSVCFGEV